MQDSKKSMRALDLAISAGRRRQSPRTKFVHYFARDDSVSDTIPLFENFCFAFALFRKKTAESILEGKELILRLIAFQLEDGNFPTYLHEFPKAWDVQLKVKIGRILMQIIQDFGQVLEALYKEKLERALAKIDLHLYRNNLKNRDFDNEAAQIFDLERATIAARQGASEDQKDAAKPTLSKTESSSCFGIPPPPQTAQMWFDWILAQQVSEKGGVYPIPYHPELQVFLGGALLQEKGEPQALPIEYVLAEESGYFSPRLLSDHIHQLHSALLFPFYSSKQSKNSYVWCDSLLLWKGASLHTLCFSKGVKEGNEIAFEFLEDAEERKCLPEAFFYCDISPETFLLINGRKGTVFHFGDTVSICTPSLQVDLSFRLFSGQGEFCGQISRGNRSSQTENRGVNLYEAYDWQIGLRCLRKKGPCKILARIQIIENHLQ